MKSTTSKGGAIRFSIRKLSILVLILLLSSQFLFGVVRSSGVAIKNESEGPIVTHWRLQDNKRAKVRFSALQDSSAVGYIEPGTQVTAYSWTHSNKYLFLVSPIRGFVLKKIFDPLPEKDYDSSPIMYTGYRREGPGMVKRFTYAPTSLVVAQQLWNAVQVLQTFLVIALYYVKVIACRTPVYSRCFCVVTGLSMFFAFALLLPFSVYVTSPGSTVFGILVLVSTVLGIRTDTILVLDVSGRPRHIVAGGATTEDEEMGSTMLLIRKVQVVALPEWFLAKEEVIGFFCNLCSSLYNYNASFYVWPHWRKYFFRIDRHFGWKGRPSKFTDVFNMNYYTLGTNVEIPLYLPGGRGSTFGVHFFWILWSVIPVLYVSYFTCMFVLAKRSPGVKIQRALLLFSIFHFLFMTGK